jgi:transposase
VSALRCNAATRAGQKPPRIWLYFTSRITYLPCSPSNSRFSRRDACPLALPRRSSDSEEDVSEQLERIPATYKVIRHVRPKFACAGCERVVEAPAPARPIEHGLPGPGLLAHVLVSKFGDHLPLYRQSEIYAREGVDLGRSTLAGWVGAASELLAPLVDEIRRHVMAASKIHADGTPVPVLAPGNGKTKTENPITHGTLPRSHTTRG